MKNILNSEVVKIAENTNYTNQNFQYLKNVEITEWDIRSAGFSVLKFKKLLSESELEALSKLDKHTRTVKEGLLQKSNPKISEEIINTLSKVRQAFVILNNILPENILSIKKDALFLINSNIEKPIIKDVFEFRLKNIYTSYLNLNKKEFFYNSNAQVLDCKGLPKESLNSPLLKEIANFLKVSEKIQSDVLFKLLAAYRMKYLSFQLPIENYRELETGCYRINDYLSESVEEEMKENLDISQNYMNFILPIIQAML